MPSSRLPERLDSLRPVVFLLARLLVAVVFLYHSLPKALDVSMAYAKFVGFGLPGALGPVIGWVEVVASVLLVAGYRPRWAALVLAAIILGALLAVQIPGGITASLERDLLILMLTLVLATHGPGRLAASEAKPTRVAMQEAG